jgi:hypothetical protein
MNYTEKYHLPQWEETDRVMRTDFNDAMAGIETGIESVRTEARQADAELTKKVTAAQKTADTARTEAAQKPYVVGTYVGSGTLDVDVKVGFRPSAVVGFGNQGFENSSETIGRVFAFGALVTSGVFTLSDTGFTVKGGGSRYPRANVNGVLYQYIAFR